MPEPVVFVNPGSGTGTELTDLEAIFLEYESRAGALRVWTLSPVVSPVVSSD